MNDTNPVGDLNVERLLGTAYKPEVPDPAFALDVEEHLLFVAHQLAEERAVGQASALARSGTEYRRVRRRLAWAMGVAASIAVAALVWYARAPRGPYVFSSIKDAAVRAKQGSGNVASSLAHDLAYGLTPRPRSAAEPATPVEIGQAIVTRAGERRRVALADGSILYVNQNTEIKQVDARRLNLSRGEVYLEVARTAGAENRFVVATPRRQVTALGTRFAVQASEDDTGVVVTQGQVQVSGIDKVVEAGQQLAPGSEAIGPAPRASHLLDWTRELMAAAESPLVPCSKHGGGALIAIDPSGQEVNLSLRKFIIDVHIEDGFARTTIDQTYFNNLHSDTEGTFYFPLPPDATLSRLAMYVVDGNACKLMEGGMAEREHARNVFETIRYTNRDPALLEWVDGSTFKMRVFPLEARREKRVLLSYTQRLASLYGVLRYRFPAGHNMELIKDWSFQATVKNGTSSRITSDSHPDMKLTTSSLDTVATVSAKNTKPDRDVTLEVFDKGTPTLGRGQETTPQHVRDITRFSSFLHEGHQYLMLRYRPALSSQAKRERRDWVFLFEAGGNRDPLLARAQIEVIRTLLENANHDDTFAVITAGTRVRLFDKETRRVTPRNIEEAVKFLDTTHLIGALDLEQALRAATPLLQKADRPYLVHVGAGVPAMGERRDDVLAKQIPENTRYVGIGVGKRWNRAFMKMAADRSSGYFTQINPDEPISWRAFELLATLNTPRLMELRVVDNAESATFLSETASLAQGEEVCAIARIGKDGELPSKVTVSGKVNGKPFVKQIAVDNIAHNAGYLPRQWAKLEIDHLLADDGEKNKKAIIELSKAMYVMSPYTSLLVLETEADYQRFQVDRGRKDHWAMYSCPEKIAIVYEPANRWGGVPAKVEGKKLKPSEVLQTILVRIAPPLLTLPNQPNLAGVHALTALQLYSGAYAMPMLEQELRMPPGNGALTFGVELNFDVLDRKLLRSFDDQGPVSNRGQFKGAMPSRLALPGTTPAGESGQRGLDQRLLTWTRSEPAFRPMGGPGWHPGFGAQPTVHPGGGGSGPPGVMPLGGGMPMMGGMQMMGGMMSGMGGMMPSTMMGMMPSSGMGNVDWTHYYRNGYQINTNGPMVMDGSQRIQFAPVFVSPTMQWGIPNSGLTTPPGPVPPAMMPPWPSRPGSPVADTRSLIMPALSMTSPAAETPSPKAFATGGGSRSSEEKDSKDKHVAGTWQELLAEEMAARLTQGYGLRSVLYQRPTFTVDHRLFGDLLIHAPGLNTSDTDIQALLETESTAGSNAAIGQIDPAAKALIDRARKAGWSCLTLPAGDKRDDVKIFFNGAGQYSFERTLSSGLREQVVCDGTTLLHLYPELGLGARRGVSRFHRAELGNLVPWHLPPAEDLAQGFDLQLADERTVAIVPRVAAAKDGKAVVTRHLHLVFAKNGELRERRLIDMPSGKILYRESYSEGLIKYHGRHAVAEHQLTVAEAEAPDLKPNTGRLVLVPMPLRTREYQYAQLMNWNGLYNDLDADVTIGLIAADCWQQNGGQALHAFGERFAAKGDRRIGFYTLLAAAHVHIQPGNVYRWNQAEVKFNIEAEHPKDPLARFLAHYNSSLSQGYTKDLGLLPGPRDSFLNRLGEFYDLYTAWSQGRQPQGTDQQRRAQRERVLTYVKNTAAPVQAWIMLDIIQRNGGNDADYHRVAADVHKRFGDETGLVYAARYEHARNLLQAGDRDKAQKAFRELYADALKAGQLPLIDAQFREAFRGQQDGEMFAELMRQTAGEFVKKKQFGTGVLLAWQLWQLGEQPLADELYAGTMAAAGKNSSLMLVGIDYLWQTSQWARADALLQKLLEDEQLAQRPAIWRLGAALAQRRGLTGRYVAYLEKAMDLEFKNLPEAVNLQTVRQDYSGLLQHYQQLAMALTMLETEPSRDFVAKIVRAADRWRSLDHDSTSACQQAARILQTLGARELAWEYLTTPIGLKPNEAAPWVSLAQTLRTEAEYDLADRAYTMAYQAEPTNAQILWDRAQNLQQLGRVDQARQVYRQLADGSWQPRFQGLQNQARSYLSNN